MPRTVTVIIPTYNRADILSKTLKGYAAQGGDHRILEVIVIDDGSKDHTRDVVEEAACSQPNLRYYFQQNAGLAAARNHAIQRAKGDLLLFGDDDIIPSSTLTAEHIRGHLEKPAEEIGILGYVPWSPDRNPSPF